LDVTGIFRFTKEPADLRRIARFRVRLADLSGTAVICPAPDLLRETKGLPSVDASLPSPSHRYGRMRWIGRHTVRFGELPVSGRTDIVARLPVMDCPAAALTSVRARQPTGLYLHSNILRGGECKLGVENRVSEVGGPRGRDGK
jgi:hypothetical protein